MDQKAQEEERKHPLWMPVEGRPMDRPTALGRQIIFFFTNRSQLDPFIWQ